MTTEKYIETYINATITCIEAMFGIPMAVENTEMPYIKESTFKTREQMIINIPFSGSISGDYFLCINESEWSKYFKESLGDGSIEMVNSCVKELLNTIVGDAITIIQEDFPDLTFLSPRIYRGTMDYPDTMTLSSALKAETFSEITISLCINMMRQDIGLKLDEVLEQVKAEKAKLMKAESTVKSIMSNIEQGIFNIDVNGIISPGCSSKLASLFKKNIVDIEEKSFDEVCLPDLLKSRHGELAKWLDFVNLAPSNMNWQDIVGLAPFNEEDFNHKGTDYIYSFNYHKVDVDDTLSIMVIIEDITEQRIAEQKLAEAKREYESNLELLNNVISLSNSELFSFLQECDCILNEIEEINEDSEIDVNTLNHLFRSIHSLKGGAATLNFNELSESAHRVEDYLDILRQQHKTTEGKDITNRIYSIKSELNNIYSIINRFNISQKSKEKENHLMINDQSLEQTIADFMELDFNKPIGKDNRDRLLDSLNNLKTVPLHSCEPTIRNMVDTISKDLGKKTALVIDKEFSLPHSIFHHLSNPLIHLIRNALDHGIELPKVREKNGKNSIATISIRGEIKNDSYVVKISDDGQGIQQDKIKKIAVQKGLVKSTDLDDNQICDLIFHPGLSTKTNVTKLSGRGVGLDAVKVTVKDLGGSIEVDNNEGKGTTFVLTIPCKNSSIGATK